MSTSIVRLYLLHAPSAPALIRGAEPLCKRLLRPLPGSICVWFPGVLRACARFNPWLSSVIPAGMDLPDKRPNGPATQ